jgi:DNA-binding transcriptional LysR family regulator
MQGRAVDLNLVRIFARVAETRSFTRAARELRVPTSSVSRAIARLEAQLGAPLFERTTRRTNLTVAGRAYHESACRVLRELSEGERRVSELQAAPRGEVRIAVAADIDDGFLASRLVAFARAQPQIQLAIAVSNQMVDLVADGFDLALRVASKLPDSPLVAFKLGTYHAWLVASTEYVVRRGVPRRPNQLKEHDCVQTRPRDGASQWTLRGPRGKETITVRGPLAADDMNFVRQLVLGGAGIGLLPIAPPGKDEVSDERLVRVLPDYVMPGPSLYLVTPSSSKPPARVALVKQFIVESYAATTSPTEP